MTAQHAALLEHQARPARGPPLARACASASRPMKSRSSGSNATVQARPDSRGWWVSSMSLPYRFMPASRRSVSRAPRPAGATPCARSARQASAASGGRQHDLEAVLAGVAGAREEPGVERGRRRIARCRAPCRDARRTGACAVLSRALGPCTASIGEIRALAHRDAERRRVLADPGEIFAARAGIDHQAEPGSPSGSRRSDRRSRRRSAAACRNTGPCRGS